MLWKLISFVALWYFVTAKGTLGTLAKRSALVFRVASIPKSAGGEENSSAEINFHSIELRDACLIRKPFAVKVVKANLLLKAAGC